MIRTVLELDLVGYTDIAVALEEALDIEAVRTFEDQIQSFVDEGLAAIGLERDRVVLGTAGDNAILIFESAEQMHQFAATVADACRRYNAGKTTPLARRWFRMGAATGEIQLDREKRRIIGTTIARAVRLEAASSQGVLLIDQATYQALPEWLRKAYGPQETVKGKRQEQFTAYRIRFIDKALIDDGTAGGGRRIPKLLPVAVALLVAIGSALGISLWWRKPTAPLPPPNRDAAAPTPDAPPTVSIRGTAEIRVFNPDVPERNDRSISYPSLLPLRPGDQVRFEVRLDRPAFLYLLWVAPSGDVIPVYPWKQGDWTRVEDQRPVSRLIYPAEDSDGFPMKPGVEGREVFLALASPSPLPADVDLKGIIARCTPKLPVRNPKALVRFRGREIEATEGQDRDPDFLLPGQSDDPFRRMADQLRREVGRYFDFIDGAAFSSRIPR
jgi:class 3 adenylate cyclase